MGDDGAKGLVDMHNTGSLTIAQNEESCVVYGMPRKAVESGAVDEILNLEGIVNRLIRLR
jgi:two-component system chemotaxis response regulator CheB